MSVEFLNNCITIRPSVKRRMTMFRPLRMRSQVPAVILAAIGAISALCCSISQATDTTPLKGDAERGKYVALAADCMSCHTAPGGKPFAGGNALKSAFGTLYGPNITADVQTGIGAWNKAEFERALRSGVRKDGAYLYPAMPYGSYTKMTAADMDDLWTYIHAIPAVSNTVPKNTLPFPLTIRSGVAVWQDLYFAPGPFKPSAGKSADWNRGAYLVDALGHCSDCHTPRNVAQGLQMQHRLAGATIEGWYAPDISNDPLSKLTTWKTDDLAKYLKTGVGPGNVKTFGPMQEVVHDSLSQLHDSDLKAMAVYLKDQPHDSTSASASKAKMPAENLARGKALYADNCSSCHQRDGKGIAGTAPALAGNDAVTAAEPYNLIMAMLEGFPAQGNWGAMGSFANTLSDDQIADVANYIRTAWGNDAAPNAAPWSVGNWREHAAVVQPNQADALLCPNLQQDVIQPALDAGADALTKAARGGAGMNSLVSRYMTARPRSSTAQVIEALSTAYCRTVADQHLSQARASAQIADFAQRVAAAVGTRKPRA
jgi:mono/diheme cytochrome c family protein